MIKGRNSLVLFSLPAFAADAPTPPAAPGMMLQLLPFVLIIIIFYFLLIRPQKKRQEEHQKMISELKKGDDVVTVGGILGQVADVRDDHFVIKVADNVRVKMTKSSVVSKASGAPAPAAVEGGK